MTSILGPDALGRIERAVAGAEQRTAAEVVVVLSRAAARYRSADLVMGALLGVTALTAVVYSPVDVSPDLVVPVTMAAFAAGVALAQRVPALKARLITRDRGKRALADAAKIAFVDHAVSATRDRTGILLFYCDLEEGLEIMPDLGIQGKVAGHVFNEIRRRFDEDRRAPACDRLVRAIAEVGEAVSPAFPRRADDVNELPDAPRVQGS